MNIDLLSTNYGYQASCSPYCQPDCACDPYEACGPDNSDCDPNGGCAPDNPCDPFA